MPLKQMGDLGQVVVIKGWSMGDDDMTRYALSRSQVRDAASATQGVLLCLRCGADRTAPGWHQVGGLTPPHLRTSLPSATSLSTQIVINLIGANYETRNFSYDDVHATWPAHLAKLSKENPLMERCARLRLGLQLRAGPVAVYSAISAPLWLGWCSTAAADVLAEGVLVEAPGHKTTHTRAIPEPWGFTDATSPDPAPSPPPRAARFIHFSDVGADPQSASRRMRSKAAGDAAVLEALPGLATILRPAPVVGDEDDFLNNLLMQVRAGGACLCRAGQCAPLPALMAATDAANPRLLLPVACPLDAPCRQPHHLRPFIPHAQPNAAPR